MSNIAKIVVDGHVFSPGGGGDIDALIDRSITEITSNATSIGNFVFYHCVLLTSVSFPLATSIEASAFSGCSSLASVSFPLATSIGVNAFFGCSSLASVSFPLATSIGSSAFYDCSSLASVSFPLATSIEASAFSGCIFTSVSFPLLTSIGSSAFSNCSSLASAKFLSARTIKSFAFNGCAQLQSIELGYNGVCNLESTSGFPASASHHITIYVPASQIASYQTAARWSTFYNNGYIDFQAISE